MLIAAYVADSGSRSLARSSSTAFYSVAGLRGRDGPRAHELNDVQQQKLDDLVDQLDQAARALMPTQRRRDADVAPRAT